MDRFVIMGVSGCGKSSIGRAFATRIGATFVDGDDLHPALNVAKMATGTPLDDVDRAPWLAAVGETFAVGDLPIVVACSALKRSYRDIIRAGAGGPVLFLHLDGARDVLAQRMAARTGHFMPAGLLDSQIATLEPLGADEAALRVDIDQAPDAIVAAFVADLKKELR